MNNKDSLQITDFESGITLNCFMDKIMYIKPTQISEHKDDDYHIYFICSLPKAYFIKDSIKFTASKLSCELIHNSENIKIDKSYLEIFDGSPLTETDFTLSKDNSTLTLTFYKNFIKQKEVVVSANEIFGASGLMETKKEKILYIGQAFGESGKRTAGVRLENHSTLQRILSDIQSSGSDEEVQLYLMNFKMEHILQLSGYSSRAKNDAAANTFFDTMDDYNQEMCINLVEASLINYFKPKYNVQYKKKIFSQNSSKFKIFYQNNISKISVQILPTEYSDEYLSQMNIRMPRIIFYTDCVEYNTGSYNEFITTNLDQNLYSTFAQLKAL